jgi:hypothetical protein
METAQFLYKCRNCGTIYEGNSTSSYTNMRFNFMHLLKYGKPMKNKGHGGEYPGLTDIHFCNDQVEGVADLVGLKKDD